MRIFFGFISLIPDSVSAGILSQINPEFSAGILHHSSRGNYPLTSSLLTQVFTYKMCRSARYENAPFFAESPPLDSDMLSMMAPYESELLHELTRSRFPDYRSLWNDYCNHLRYWNHALSAMRIELFVACPTPHFLPHTLIAYLCKLKNIPTITLDKSPVKGFCYFTDFPSGSTAHVQRIQKETRAAYENATENEIPLTPPFEEQYQRLSEHLSVSSSSTEKPINDSAFSAIFTGLPKPFLSGEARLFQKNMLYKKHLYKYAFWRRCRNIYMRACFLIFLLRKILSFNDRDYENIRIRLFKKFIFSEYDLFFRYYRKRICQQIENEKFFYVPLHTQPELTTRPFGGIFGDQILMIKMLSFHLPDGYYLYVKEHPIQLRRSVQGPSRASRHIEFFREMAKLENVKFLPVDMDTHRLQKECVAVATITGSAGLEAVHKGKPVLMFGESLALHAPGVFKIRTNNDCAEAIRKITTEKTVISPKELRIFYKTMEQCTNNAFIEVSIPVGYSGSELEAAYKTTTDLLVQRIAEFDKA